MLLPEIHIVWPSGVTFLSDFIIYSVESKLQHLLCVIVPALNHFQQQFSQSFAKTSYGGSIST